MTERSPSDKASSKKWPILEVLRVSRAAVCVCLSVSLVGCNATVSTPVITMSPGPQTALPAAAVTEPAPTPTAAAVATRPGSLASGNAAELLQSAVANLQTAASFRMAAHEIRAYQIFDTSGARTMVYGEFVTDYAIIRLPTLKVHAYYEYRYDPQADFAANESYMYQQNGKYFARLVEASITSDAEEIDIQSVQPIGGDVYQTLVTYSSEAEFAAESNGMAQYTLEHPEWYRLEGAIGFSDLGLLHGQENGDQLVRQYVAEHYPNVKSLQFTIYVAVNEQLIARVVVEDEGFMISVWAEVERALIERGEDPNKLPRYEVMSANGAEYLFSDYSQVQDFEIP